MAPFVKRTSSFNSLRERSLLKAPLSLKDPVICSLSVIPVEKKYWVTQSTYWTVIFRSPYMKSNRKAFKVSLHFYNFLHQFLQHKTYSIDWSTKTPWTRSMWYLSYSQVIHQLTIFIIIELCSNRTTHTEVEQYVIIVVTDQMEKLVKGQKSSLSY